MPSKLTQGSLLAAALLALAAATPANALGGVRAGALNCQGPGTTSHFVGSHTSMLCVFTPTVTRKPERYVANLQRVGFDIGQTNQSMMGWVVFAPTRYIGPGDIAGTYGGVSGGAVIGIGGTANVLVGGSQNSFALQPVSFQGATGFNITAGVAGMTLEEMYPMRKRKVRRSRR